MSGKRYKALQNLGIRGFEVMRPQCEYDEEELKSRFIKALERTGVIEIVPGYGDVPEEAVVSGEPPEEDDPRYQETTAEFPVQPGERKLTDFEAKCWRKYLLGDDLDGNEEAGIQRAKVKMGLESPEGDESEDDEPEESEED